MTPWARPRALRPSELDQLGQLLAALAGQLSRPEAPAMLTNAALAADPYWPSKASGAASIGGGGSGPSSPVEAALWHRDAGMAERARIMLADLAQLGPNLRRVLAVLAEYDPSRPLELCTRCGHPLDREYRRCQQVTDGVQCGTRGAERRCRTCDEPQPPGRALRGGECNACRMSRIRNGGRARVATSQLALSAGLLTEDGAYSAP